jgi:hypothetical protein
VGIETGAHHTEPIGGAELDQPQGLLHLFDRHSEMQAVQIGIRFEFTNF